MKFARGVAYFAALAFLLMALPAFGGVYKDATVEQPFKYVAEGDGTNAIASVTLDAGDADDLDLTNFHMTIIVQLSDLDDGHVFFRREWDSDTIMEFGINTSKQVYFTVGYLDGTMKTATVVETAPVLATNHLNRPIEVSMSWDASNDEFIGCIDGVCGAAIAATQDYDTSNTTDDEILTIGLFDGYLWGLWIGTDEHFQASSWYYPWQPIMGAMYPGVVAMWAPNINRDVDWVDDPIGGLDLLFTGSWGQAN